MSMLNKFRPLPARDHAPRLVHGQDPRLPLAPLHAAASAPPVGSERAGRFSNGLKEFLWQLDDIGRGNLLDLGQVSQNTLNFFIERNFKVYTEDVLVTWRDFVRAEDDRAKQRPAGSEAPDNTPGARADRFLDANFNHPKES